MNAYTYLHHSSYVPVYSLDSHGISLWLSPTSQDANPQLSVGKSHLSQQQGLLYCALILVWDQMYTGKQL